MTAVPLGETPTLCVLCPPSRAKVAMSGSQVDYDCHLRMEDLLVELVKRYARLTAMPGGGQAQGRRSPGFRSTPPVNLHNVALRDPRTAPTELGEIHSPLNFLLSWGRWMRRERRQTPAHYPEAATDLEIADLEATYLFASLDWVGRQAWVTRFHDQLRVCVSQVRAATGEPNPRPVGTCTCGHPLFPPREGEINIRCGNCAKLYEPLDQIRLVRAHLAGCTGCGHDDAQHCNDATPRPCNVEWCACTDYRPPEAP